MILGEDPSRVKRRIDIRLNVPPLTALLWSGLHCHQHLLLNAWAAVLYWCWLRCAVRAGAGADMAAAWIGIYMGTVLQPIKSVPTA